MIVLEWIKQGGWVMYPILFLSFVGLVLVCERMWVFWQFFHHPIVLKNQQQQLDNLQQRFGVISTIITAEPMLGILGTVTGIIKTFSAFKGSESVMPFEVTSGIAEALITTAAGIVAALILLFPYNYLLGCLSSARTRLEDEE